MSILIAIDDGHGMETAGKRTPLFPSTKYFMHENEFNNAVAQKLKANLERCGFKTLMVAPGDTDVPLAARTNAANKAQADFYISIHANAMTGVWQSAAGIETYHYPTAVKGKSAAIIIHKYLMRGTPFKDRKVKSANFHVLRETNMPAVLVECGFMDNLEDAKLLLLDTYRQECADEIAQGICEYFSVSFIPEQTELTFEQALLVIAEFAKIDPSYWGQRNNIDKYFPEFNIKIARAINALKR